MDVPITESAVVGVDVPIPTLPALVIVNSLALDDEDSAKMSDVPAVPYISNLDKGEDVPIPILPDCFTTKNDVPEDEATLNGSNAPAVPCMLKFMVDEVALTP